MEIISSIATKISEYAIDAIIHQFGYIVNFKDNMKDLKEQAENLVSARTRMQHLVDEAMDKAEDIEDNVQIWFTRVDEITQETNTFLINIGGEEKSCLTGSCFTPVQRHRLSRKAKKMAYELAKIQEQGKSIDKVSYRGPLPGIDYNPHYLTFESRKSIMEEIMTGLKDPNIYMIGVYGMGGIGKTMLVKEISCQVKKSKLLEPVIMATVGQNSDVRHIQGLLGEKLSLTFGQETEEGRADLLRKRLQTEKKFLIIFDDIWNGIDLERVGIPSTGNDKGRKILVTSRSNHVLSNEMSIENNFEVKDLTREESWKFFKNIVGESIETDRQLNKIAIEVANKCGKLPIALVIVAKALKGKHLPTWRDALRQLKNPTSVDIEGVSREVYASLKLSYDNLNGREAQLLFLLCSIFPDDYNIHTEHLSRYAMGLKFLQGIDTLGTTRDKILTMVDHLISSCLLQKSDLSCGETQRVKMHDVVRDVAIYIASKDDQMRTLSYGTGLNKWQDEKTHGHYKAILVNCTNFQDLPEKFNFPKVELLALINKSYTENDLWIREGCLEGMESLKVLHLKKLHFSIPPSSFNYLVKLRILTLTGCRLGSIDMIGDLKHLEILDFSKSDIVELPLSVRQLSRLKELNLSGCKQLEVIPSGVISRLTSLEELDLKNSFDGWEVEGFIYSQKKNTSLSELNYLPCLRRVYLCIPDVRYLPENEFLNDSDLESFQILIGKHWDGSMFTSTKKMLDIKTDSRNVLFKEWIDRLLIKSERLVLEAKNVLLELKRSMSPHLRHLRLGNNEDVEYIVSELDQKLSYNGFSILVTLQLWNMRRLVTIIQGYSVKTVNVFEKLEVLTVENCEKMKYLFPFSIMKALRNLENIEVGNCEMMEAIVVIENEEQIEATIEFRRLRVLQLDYLPQLMGFCCKVKAKELIQSQSSEIVEEVDEDQLIANAITPFDGQIGFPNSKELHILRLHKVKNIWHDLVIANNFIELDVLTVYDCENLITIFDGEMTENQTLCIRWLFLGKLPNLKQVWNEVPDGDVISFQCLTVNVHLKECQELKRLFPSYLSKHLQQLESLEITKCGIDEIFESELEIFKVSFPSLMLLEIQDVDNLEIIWHNKLIVDDMYKLQSVKLKNCKSLKSIFTSNVMKALKTLKELSIHNCDSLEDVFEIQWMTDREERENHEVATINLKKLKLCNLQNLKHVWSNDPYGMYQFQNLQDVEVIKCPKLETIFPPSLARDLPYHLQRLHVDVSLDEIFMNQETSKIETLEAEIRFDKDAFIKLREMELDGKTAIRELLCHTNFSKDLFPALKVVKLKDLDDYESAPFSLEFHQLLYNLEELEVHKAFLVEIFSYDKAFTTTNERNQSTRYSSSALKRLYLRNLPKLLHIWKQGSHTVQPSFDNLEVVHVKNCSRLDTLVMSSSFSFQNLKDLTICKCHGLSYLLDPSVAKTLVRLKTMNLFECKNMTTVIVGREDEREEDEIVFSELEVLKLYDLPKLKMFQFAKGAIRFPYLKTLEIKQCPEMTTFTHGPGLVCTPLLKSITDAVKSWPKPKKYWAGNINATIRRLWEDDFHDSIHRLFKDEGKVNED